MPNLISLLGIRLQLLIGRPDSPMPAPFEVVDALIDLSVTNQDRERDVFQMQFALGKDSALDYGLLAGGVLDIPNRVIITMLFGGMPQTLIDGVITHWQVQPSNEPGRSTFHVTGEDRTARLSFQDRSATHPNQSDSTIVRQILTDAGFTPQVTDTSDTPDDRERISTQQCNNLQFVQRLAQRNGFVFYTEPTDIPGITMAYWGPERRQGAPQQPALTMNMGSQTNVDTPINFQFNGLGAVEPQVSIIEPFTHSSIAIPVPTSLFSALSSSPAQALRTSIARDTANLSFAQALLRATVGSVDSASSIEASGEVDAACYGRAIRPRRLIEVRGAGQMHDGTYYVRKVDHHIRKRPHGEYKMNFTLTREGRGATSTSIGPQTSD
jgi:late control gene D protein (GPD)